MGSAPARPLPGAGCGAGFAGAGAGLGSATGGGGGAGRETSAVSAGGEGSRCVGRSGISAVSAGRCVDLSTDLGDCFEAVVTHTAAPASTTSANAANGANSRAD